ncbi:hypothetical protein [Nonomuraea sp. NPDC049028]|uniref:hypothetical protein n=1 Tax=Nonomuraea sp. NPDC049028 TaxID=3364348 RepID=UPI00371F347B
MIEQLVGKSCKFNLGALKVWFIFDSQTQGSFVVEEGGGLAPDGHAETVPAGKRPYRRTLGRHPGPHLSRRDNQRQSDGLTPGRQERSGYAPCKIWDLILRASTPTATQEGKSKWGTSP